MTFVAGRPWDIFKAELADTMRGQDEHPQARACVFCGALTRSRYRVCLAHDDLIDLDPGYPAALVEPREHASRDELAAELSPPTLGSTSAAAHGDGTQAGTNGDGPADAAALDSLGAPWAAS